MRRTARKGQLGRQGGFTLFEIIMVLLILGVIFYVATSRIFTQDSVTSASEMDQVKNHLRYAQARAMNTDRNWGIVFELPSKYWLYYEESEGGNKVSVRLPGDDTSTDNRMTLKSLTMISITNSLYSNEVRFFCGSSKSTWTWSGKFGSPSSSNDTIDININTSAGTIIIKPNTGFIP